MSLFNAPYGIIIIPPVLLDQSTVVCCLQFTFLACVKAFLSSSLGRLSPKLMMESSRTPRQLGLSHRREVAWSNTPSASLCVHSNSAYIQTRIVLKGSSITIDFPSSSFILPGLKVSQVLPSALATGLQVCVAMQFSKLCRAQPTVCVYVCVCECVGGCV